MTSDKKTKFTAGIILLSGTILMILWKQFLPELLNKLWKTFTFLPAHIYFPAEEFLALNINHNSLYIIIGGFCIGVFTVISALKINGKLKKWYEYLILLLIIAGMAVIIMPCLCVPAELGKRIRCQSYLKTIYVECNLYALENADYFPDSANTGNLKHSVNYFGKNKKRTDLPFIILEDAEKIHAGDMRHQIWSNGEIKTIYPWQKQNTKQYKNNSSR